MSQSYKPSSRETPSFSSTLLDAIYRSIESENHEEFSSGGKPNHAREILRRETWSEKKEVRSTTTSTHHGKVFLRRKSMEYVQDNYGGNSKNKESDFMFLKKSSWSSSDSSFSGGLSSFDTEFLQHVGKIQSSNYSMHRPKPIRTTTLSSHHQEETRSLDHRRAERNDFKTVSDQAKNRSGTNKLENKDEADNFVKMKLRALKIYGDLKKVKQPISPGGRIASFVNSLFAANGNNKKEKKSAQYYNNEDERRKSKSTNGSTCSSASSFSRSCLSKTPTTSSSSSSCSTKENHHQVKRSVRFCPVNVILDDDQHCGAKGKPLYQQQSDYSLKSKKADYSANHNHNNKEFKFVVRDESFMIKNDIRELLKKFQQKSSSADYMNDINSDNENRDDEDEDAASCASSDLFELDSLAACNNGLGRYTEELPVYETTYLDTRRLSSGLMV